MRELDTLIRSHSPRPTRRVGRSGPARRIGRRTRRVLWTVTGVFLLVVALWSWFAITKVYFPKLDPVPDDVDVVMQVGGASPSTYPEAREFAREHDIPNLVISEPTGIQQRWDSYCAPLEGVEVHCFSPDPSTTRGEAREFALMADDNGWDSAYVLSTGREHVERVRLYVERCWDGTLAVNKPAGNSSFTGHLYQAVYQTAGWVRALKDREC
jgi:hypothetical protein